MLEGALRSLRVLRRDRRGRRRPLDRPDRGDRPPATPTGSWSSRSPTSRRSATRASGRAERGLDPARRRRRAHHARARARDRARRSAGRLTCSAFRAPTINFFWGRRMEHGGWGADEQVAAHPPRPRRVQRPGARETPRPAGPDRARCSGERWHFSHRSIEEDLVKAIRYGRLEARDLFDAGARRVTPLDVRARHGARVRPPDGAPQPAGATGCRGSSRRCSSRSRCSAPG